MQGVVSPSVHGRFVASTVASNMSQTIVTYRKQLTQMSFLPRLFLPHSKTKTRAMGVSISATAKDCDKPTRSQDSHTAAIRKTDAIPLPTLRKTGSGAIQWRKRCSPLYATTVRAWVLGFLVSYVAALSFSSCPLQAPVSARG